MVFVQTGRNVGLLGCCRGVDLRSRVLTIGVMEDAHWFLSVAETGPVGGLTATPTALQSGGQVEL